MTLGAWILIVFSWGVIISLATFCFSQMFKRGKL